MSERIVIVEDEVFAAKIVRYVLGEAGYDVETFPSSRQAIPEILTRETDLVILDVNLPQVDGFQLCSELRARRYKGPIIFVSGKSETSCKVEGLTVGGDDYIVKPYDPSELIARVDSVIRRYKSADQQALGSVVRVGDAELSISTFSYQSSQSPPIELAPTEMRLLECLMRNSGIVLSRETLIERVWGYDFVGDSNRVDVYIRRLRGKIEPDPGNPSYVRTVRGLGYVFRPLEETGSPTNDLFNQYHADNVAAGGA
jgi:two-component system, OmpR family, response regulator RegX3